MKSIQEQALFIADAHYPTHGDALLQLLYRIEAGNTTVSQLFLMGDIFDLLVGGLEESIPPNREAITLIESIAAKIPVYYFEGNHDFRLEKIFQEPYIIPREQQPSYMNSNGFIIGLSHGDRFAAGWRHDLMSHIVRKPWVIALINRLYPTFVREKTKQLATKEICRELPGFEERAKRIFDAYKGAYRVIEGHYHQAKQIYGYVALPSLACQKQVGLMQDGEIKFVDFEKI